ncbi:23S rRNA pseudouridine(1911/1915/1917) synthase RluD [Buchnera aphidicola]|uniref:Pseudouridine synthase n=1 Tax=Buchnera aphidicola subsp. Rhopalosiphum maidis TaxID=118109 RepID=A0A3G2I5H1_BUCRM|nr:23S rRNA pseudouridine(1911/1915/1917) synthase RluD [Buchnera aphidicola]AYN24672.1 23S rRNA pseudouridine(1911/1915/1917) synthase RluD [Buchnera aphidicola (Rhopalosiphum maidis)]
MEKKELNAFVPYVGFTGKRLDKILSKIFIQYSRTCLKKWIIMNNVYVDGKIENQPDKKILGGAKITVCSPIEKSPINLPENILLNIIHEDNDILVINKPSGLVVHPGAGNEDGTILNALLHRYKNINHIPRCGIVHRLDKNTSGLMLIAKTISSYNQLVTLLKKRKIIRKYQGVVKGNMISGGVVNCPIMRHPSKRVCMIAHSLGKKSITHYRIINRFKLHTYVSFRLETGRTHQIRVHMLHIGYPLLGDPLYGGINYGFNNYKENEKIHQKFNFFRQALHANYIEFVHPVTKQSMSWKAPLPQDMQDLLLYLDK